MEPERTSYEIQAAGFRSRRSYPVRITPIPECTWYLQAQTHEYRPYLRYWGMTTVEDARNPTGHSTWTIWFIFREPPMENLNKHHHDGLAYFLAEKEAPHALFVPGFTFDLFVGPGGIIARGQILEGNAQPIAGGYSPEDGRKTSA